ncbi:MAG: transporter [Planctomycetota bacterium]|jgi:hypothetical protein
MSDEHFMKTTLRSWLKEGIKRLILLSAVVLVWTAAACAQDLEPRSYSNIPVGMNFLITGYGYTEGNVLSDPSLPIRDADIEVHGTMLAYARSLDFWGRSGKVDVIVPYAWADGSGEFMGEKRQRDISGFGDPRFRMSVNLYGAPAMSLKDYADYRQDIILGASLQVVPPLGQYDADKLLNIGTNRWAFKPEIGLSKAWKNVTTELAFGTYFYTDNDDFFGGKHLEQDPIYSIQSHLIYSFHNGIWVSLDGTYYWGGRTTVDGVRGDDLQENTRVGATLAIPMNRHNSIKLYASTGVSTRFGSDFDLVGIGWQYRWGGGLK